MTHLGTLGALWPYLLLPLCFTMCCIVFITNYGRVVLLLSLIYWMLFLIGFNNTIILICFLFGLICFGGAPWSPVYTSPKRDSKKSICMWVKGLIANEKC